ncbi:MAG TPA: FAD-linked oxidase C-terminal domain-containing protein [Acidimicrobiales bacterium]|nr:FAD-linked oxidase C-terminal domain-containing protein [Acidimicrobiales bacterium]
MQRARSEDLAGELAAALGPEAVRTGSMERSLYARDASMIQGEAAVVCLCASRADVQAAVDIARRHGRAVVPRGAGTGLAGGAVPVSEDGAPPVVLVTTRMNRVVEVDPAQRVAWVQPGVLNLDLSRQVAPLGLHFAPDPSSQQACSIGGNVANNSGGPHCLAYGVTSAHVLAVEVVLSDGSVTTLGGLDPEPAGYDLRGAFVGSEGTMGIATAVAVRLTPLPPVIRTLLVGFATAEDAAATVSAVIAAGVVPAALEMMDQRITAAVEDFVHAGFPTDAAAVLLVEVDGLASGVEAAAETVARLARDGGATSVRVAADAAERDLIWKGRKSAFGAVARLAPNYYLHDTVVPRTRLADILNAVYAVADRNQVAVMNVFHAGDGNLHPLFLFDRRVPGALERVHAAAEEVLRICLDAGGALSGEHGIGLEKRDYMPLLFSEADLVAQDGLRDAFDPMRLFNPLKVLPSGSRCGDLQAVPAGAWV